MDRRAFIGTLAGGLVAAPISAQPRQAGKVVTIGILAIEPFPPTWGTPAVLAAKRATKTIPIVMGAIGDPIASGAVSSLARPGANVTGLSSQSSELEGKRVELLKEVVPHLSQIAVLVNPTNRTYTTPALQHVRLLAQTLR